MDGTFRHICAVCRDYNGTVEISYLGKLAAQIFIHERLIVS